MKLLVTGSLGLVGSACVTFFQEKGWEVVGIDNNMRSKLFGTPHKESDISSDIDIREESEVNKLFQVYTFDAIIHTAAQPSHDWAKNEPLTDFDINARGTLILLEATRKYCPDATFVYVSTDKVYGENMDRRYYTPGFREENYYHETATRFTFEGTKTAKPFDEYLGLDFAGQRSLFGCSKTAADIYVQEYGNYFGMKTACFRLGCITGKNHEGAEYHGFLAYLAKCIKNGKTYKIFGNGKNVRDQIHSSDLATVFFEFINAPKSAAVYNMGGGPERSVSVLEAGELLSKAIGKPFVFEFAEARKGDRLWDIHDISKFRKDYPGWDYKYSLQDIIKDVCQK